MRPTIAPPFSFVFCVKCTGESKAASMMDLGDILARQIYRGTGKFKVFVDGGSATSLAIPTTVAVVVTSILQAGEEVIFRCFFAAEEEQIQHGEAEHFDKLLGGQRLVMLPCIELKPFANIKTGSDISAVVVPLCSLKLQMTVVARKTLSGLGDRLAVEGMVLV